MSGRPDPRRWRRLAVPRIAGFSTACELALSGDVIDAAKALACGVVSRVVPDAELLATARAFTERRTPVFKGD